MAKVVIRRVPSYEEVEGAIEEGLRSFALELAGKRVLIHPNLGRPGPLDRHSTTHPAVVAALVKLLRKAGANPMVGDNPHWPWYGGSAEVAGACGVAEAAGRHLVRLGEAVRLLPVEGLPFSPVALSTRALEADMVIAVPKLKTHRLHGISGALSGSLGLVAGGHKARLHEHAKQGDDWAPLLLALHSKRPPDLVVVDGVVAMAGTGPESRSLVRAGVVVLSDNAISADATVAVLLGLAPASIPSLALAKRKGLAEIDPSRLNILGSLQAMRGVRAPRLGGLSWLVRRRLRAAATAVPRLDERLCNLCGACVTACPARAIAPLSGALPIIDPKLCTSCAACVESCLPRALGYGRGK